MAKKEDIDDDAEAYEGREMFFSFMRNYATLNEACKRSPTLSFLLANGNYVTRISCIFVNGSTCENKFIILHRE